MATPNYKTNRDYSVNVWNPDSATLPKDSFVRPIDPYYLPRHILESSTHKGFNPRTETYVYCRVGIIIIPTDIMRKV